MRTAAQINAEIRARTTFRDALAKADKMARYVGDRGRDVHKEYIRRHLTQMLDAAMSLPAWVACAMLRQPSVAGTIRVAAKAGVDFKLPAIPDFEEGRNAYEVGKSAFEGISGRMSDAMRGTKSFPDFPACPYRLPMKAKLWHEGFNERLDDFNAAWEEDAA